MIKKYDITGMSCSACSANIEKSVGKMKGVKSVSVNLLQNNMNVDFDENTLNSDDIIKKVESCGYGAFDEKKEVKASKKDETQNTDELKNMKQRLILSLAFLIPLMYITMGHMVGLPLPAFLNGVENAVSFAFTQLLFTLPVMYINRKFYQVGFKALYHRLPNMDSLVAVGSSAAFIYGVFAIYRMSYGLGAGDLAIVAHYRHDLYFESTAMILTLITVGKFLETKSKGKTNNAIKKLLNLTPKTATVIRDGNEYVINSDNIVLGDIIIVKQGGSIPVDGIIIDGNGSVDESAITGESIPIEKNIGSKVTSATILKNGYIKMKAEKVGENTTIAQIIKLVEDASGSKAPIAKLADKVSAYFVPTVMLISLITAIVWLLLGETFEFALARAITVLVISCPCALGLATPTAIMVGMGMGAQNGILIKSAEALETLNNIDTLVFDKTGTITNGKPEVTDIITFNDFNKNEFISLLASIESKSEHPLSEAIMNYSKEQNVKIYNAESFKSIAGEGVKALINNKEYLCGNMKMMKNNNINIDDKAELINKLSTQGKTVLLFSDLNKTLGLVAVADKVKAYARETIDILHKMKIETVMLTGDNEITAKAVQEKTGISNVIAQVLPQDKQYHIKKLQEQGKRVVMVGDGINDAPALTIADIGIAIGAGTDIAIESADIVLVKSNITDVITAIKLSKSVMKNIKENLFWAFFYNCICIPVAAGLFIKSFGISLNPMLGAGAMSLSSLFVVGNALRLRFFKSAQFNTDENKLNQNTEIKKEIISMEKTVGVNGMMCAHCQGRVQKVLSQIDGVTNVIVDLENKNAKVTLSKEISDDVFKKAIEDAGYEITYIK